MNTLAVKTESTRKISKSPTKSYLTNRAILT